MPITLKKTISWTIIIGVTLIITFSIIELTHLNNAAIEINGHKFIVDIAADDLTRQQGLSDRASLGQNQGMLFIFASNSSTPFWNYHMRFPIDVVWLQGDTVVGISTLPIQNSFSTTTATAPVRYNRVLELNSGTVRKNNLLIGTHISYENITQKPQ